VVTTIYQGDALDVLRTLESESIQCVITSPPYYSLRAYGTDPKVWGGDPEHAHEWGDASQLTVGGKRGDTKVRWQHTGTGVSGHERLAPASACPCGAWRGELGSEPTPALFIEHLVMIFDEVKRVLRPDGTCWVNLGDSYAGSGKGPTGHNGIGDQGQRQGFVNGNAAAAMHVRRGFGGGEQSTSGAHGRTAGIPAKNLLLIPERFSIAMQDAGWIVRSRVAWCKTSAMPESVRDRPTSAWEHIFMFSRSPRYYYDAEAVRQPHAEETLRSFGIPKPNSRAYGHAAHQDGSGQVAAGGYGATQQKHGQGRIINPAGANLRNFWLLGPEPSSLNHYAAFPTEIPKRCILAGTSERGACPACGSPWVRISGRDVEPLHVDASSLDRYGTGDHGVHRKVGGQYQKWLDAHPKRTLDWQPSCPCPPADPVPCVVLDPFAGTFTTCLVADRLGRDSIGIDLSPAYCEIGRKRIESDAPLMAEPVVVETPVQVALFGPGEEAV
jgi:DNA modification methylase